MISGESHAALPLRVSLAEGPAAVAEYVGQVAARLAPAYPHVDWREARLRPLDAGIMNYVYRVEWPGQTFFLKQALAQVKQADRLGPDLAGVPPARIEAEWRALRWLAEALPPSCRGQVPAVAWHDAENRVLWTEDTAPGAASLQDRLAAGDCDLQAAENLGRLLGAVHHAGIGETPPLWGTWEADAANWERFLRMRTTGVLARAELPPEAERAVHALSEAARRQARRGMVSHLDAAPKNALVQPDGRVALLDFELGAAVSDPAYDVGFLTGHYRLMGEALPALRDAARQAAAALTWAYRETGPAVDSDWERRVDRYAGVTLLYRLYGSSPAPYLSPECWPQVRREGLRLLLEGDA